ncbi:sequence-specific DNA binding [Ascochyta rabiei]|uniref:Sequence-specific DNA binding n=1 Tax=Didymella rabiei TaxID=5454 RepID=A0A162XHR8_DIDRA|nr:sequence-specific DNA binding [Ascochyta rabiei]
MHPPLRNNSNRHPGNLTLSLPPLRQLSSTPPTPSTRRHDNPLGVHSILNPQAELIEQQRDRRRSGFQMETPSPVDAHHFNSLPSISRPTSVDSTQDDQTSQRLFHPPGRPSARHALTPKSPILHRTQSLGGLNRPTGTIDAHQSPFLTATMRPSEGAVSHPALPTPPAGIRTGYFPPLAGSTPTSSSSSSSSSSTTTTTTIATATTSNTLRTEMRRPSAQFLPSGSASPMAQYSPYSQPASIASGYDSHSAQGHYAPASHEAHQSGPPLEMERHLISVAPSGQSSIQIMTIKSQQGHNVQIPVDVQAASKVADEKRKRNAGASARFRARRKEKEREASMSISRLEQQVRDAVDRADFYRTERDFFRSIVYQQPGAERHCARPASPILRRLSSAPSHAASSMNEAGSDGSYGDYEEDSCDVERNVRRRTSNYQPVSGPPPAEANVAPFTPHGYASAHGPSSRGQHYAPNDQGHLSALARNTYRDSFA